jgi:hypothetical protein
MRNGIGLLKTTKILKTITTNYFAKVLVSPFSDNTQK